ncbi:sterol desaturase family protein [Sphaerotilus sp.]|uniref:sterol desaturase family protein n=1 Tax=Sphaerotilus sp. TaxID=2093942 RepID=UPI00286E8070|nr:sterol desaturase family protein [Sphaerotilus sp.]
MYLFTLEHSKTAYQTDAVLYSAAVVALASLLLLAGPRAHWLGLSACVLVGAVAWTAMEYGAHRFVLHSIAPFSRWHTAHHERPSALICAPTVVSAGLIGGLVFLPTWWAFGLWPAAALTQGVLIGYLFYTVTHHAIHHWRARGPWLKERKRWHALHHRRGEWPAYYGVTTSFWDHVFGTVQTVNPSAHTTDPSHRTTL